MVVIAIIGILTSVGIPKYQKFKARAVQAEATEGLGTIYKLNQVYFSTNDSYVEDTTGFSKLGFETSDSQRYTFSLAAASGETEGFTANAVSKRILASCANNKDEWRNDAANNLTQVKNGLDGCGGLFGIMDK